MLVLSRKKNESIIINGNIEIKIIESDDGKVRIGIDAPKEIEIHRKEVFETIKAQKEAANTKNVKLGDFKNLGIPSVKEYKKNISIKKDSQ